MGGPFKSVFASSFSVVFKQRRGRLFNKEEAALRPPHVEGRVGWRGVRFLVGGIVWVGGIAAWNALLL